MHLIDIFDFYVVCLCFILHLYCNCTLIMLCFSISLILKQLMLNWRSKCCSCCCFLSYNYIMLQIVVCENFMQNIGLLISLRTSTMRKFDLPFLLLYRNSLSRSGGSRRTSRKEDSDDDFVMESNEEGAPLSSEESQGSEEVSGHTSDQEDVEDKLQAREKSVKLGPERTDSADEEDLSDEEVCSVCKVCLLHEKERRGLWVCPRCSLFLSFSFLLDYFFGLFLISSTCLRASRQAS